MLAELTRTHLLDEHAPGRYSFHDLLRAYATELVQAAETAAERAGRPDEPCNIWCDSRGFPVLREAITNAADAGFDDHVWKLAWSIFNFCDRRCLWYDQADAHAAGIAAAQRLGERTGMAHSHRGLGLACARTGRLDDADRSLHEALLHFRAQQDAIGQGHTNLDLGWIRQRQGRYGDALGHATRALHSFSTAEMQAGQANAMNAIGWCLAMQGDYRGALAPCGDALTCFQEIDDWAGAAQTWDSLGYVHHHLGEFTEAVACYERGLELCQKLGNRFFEADILIRLGDSHAATSAAGAARDAWQRALIILTGLDHPDAQGGATDFDDWTRLRSSRPRQRRGLMAVDTRTRSAVQGGAVLDTGQPRLPSRRLARYRGPLQATPQTHSRLRRQ
jgi:tetratricopeptide (TPR) repeat protein